MCVQAYLVANSPKFVVSAIDRTYLKRRSLPSQKHVSWIIVKHSDSLRKVVNHSTVSQYLRFKLSEGGKHSTRSRPYISLQYTIHNNNIVEITLSGFCFFVFVFWNENSPCCKRSITYICLYLPCII